MFSATRLSAATKTASSIGWRFWKRCPHSADVQNYY